MSGKLFAGAARRLINPPLGTRQTGFRLFGNPVQAIESDLTATALVLGDGDTRVVVIGIDLSLVGIDLSLRCQRPAQQFRNRIAEALRIPVTHVLLNTSHTHAGVALPDYMPDSPEQMALKERYRRLARPPTRGGRGGGGCAAAAGADRLRLGRELHRRLPARAPRRPRRAGRSTRPRDRPVRRCHPRRRPRRQADLDRLPLLLPSGDDGTSVRRRIVRLPGSCPARCRDELRGSRALPAGRRGQHQPPRWHGARDRLPRDEEQGGSRTRRRGRQSRRRAFAPIPARASAGPSGTSRTSSSLPGSPSPATPAPTSEPPRRPSNSSTSRCRRSTRLTDSSCIGSARSRNVSPATHRNGRSASPRSTRTGHVCSSRPSSTVRRPAISSSRRSGSTTS